MNDWWDSVNGRGLAQGDLLPDCLLPVFAHVQPDNMSEITDIELKRARLIVITQSCDLENGKTPNVAMCPIYKLDEFEKDNKSYSTKGAWENVRKGRIEGLHLLASPDNPEKNLDSLVVDFGHIVSLPIEYLNQHAESLGNRWRLKSPFLEHFSQAFARFFMRVGLPAGISPFK